MTMKLGSEEENFLEVAVAAIPRITEIIAAFPAEYRSGLETAERRSNVELFVHWQLFGTTTFT